MRWRVSRCGEVGNVFLGCQEPTERSAISVAIAMLFDCCGMFRSSADEVAIAMWIISCNWWDKFEFRRKKWLLKLLEDVPTDFSIPLMTIWLGVHCAQLPGNPLQIVYPD